MPTQNVNLTDHQHTLIKELVKSGRYQNASEVIRAGLRLIEEHEEEQKLKVERFWAEIQKGYDARERGEYTTITSSEELTEFMDQFRMKSRLPVVREQNAEYPDQ